MGGDVEEDDIRDCIRSIRNVFTTYDQAVDVVSCLEVIFEDGYSDVIDFFDRFPRFKDPDLTPDGTVLFKNGYGLVSRSRERFRTTRLDSSRRYNS